MSGLPYKLTEQQRAALYYRRRWEGRTYAYLAGLFGLSIQGARQVFKTEHRRRQLLAEFAKVKSNPPHKIRVDQIPVSVRAFNALIRLDVLYVSEIVNYTPRDFLRLRHCGIHTLIEIEDFIARYGLSLREERTT